MQAGRAVSNVTNIGLRKWVRAKGVSLHDHSAVVVTVAKPLGVFSARCELRQEKKNSQIFVMRFDPGYPWFLHSPRSNAKLVPNMHDPHADLPKRTTKFSP
jgi:hypothetical protein